MRTSFLLLTAVIRVHVSRCTPGFCWIRFQVSFCIPYCNSSLHCWSKHLWWCTPLTFVMPHRVVCMSVRYFLGQSSCLFFRVRKIKVSALSLQWPFCSKRTPSKKSEACRSRRRKWKLPYRQGYMNPAMGGLGWALSVMMKHSRLW